MRWSAAARSAPGRNDTASCGGPSPPVATSFMASTPSCVNNAPSARAKVSPFVIGNNVVPTTRTGLPSTWTSSPIATPARCIVLAPSATSSGPSGALPVTIDETAVSGEGLFGEAGYLVAVDVGQIVDPDAGDRRDIRIGCDAPDHGRGSGLGQLVARTESLDQRVPGVTLARGSVVRRVREPEKTATPITPAIASAVPKIADRNGMARRPDPTWVTMLAAVVVVTPPKTTRRLTFERGTAAEVRGPRNPDRGRGRRHEHHDHENQRAAEENGRVEVEPARDLGPPRGADRHPT